MPLDGRESDFSIIGGISTAAKVFLRAADLIEKKGWVPYMGRMRGPHCAVTAIAAATRELVGEHAFVSALTFVKTAQSTYGHLSVWSDSAPNGAFVASGLRELASKWR